jgi:uncharacterized membrane protein YeaQ/YmgE (transglycosylase-associated protein family)
MILREKPVGVDPELQWGSQLSNAVNPHRFSGLRSIDRRDSACESDILSCAARPVFSDAHKGDDQMSFLAWIVLGLLAGFIGSKIVNKSGEGVVMDIILGVIGAVAGGWLFNMLGHSGVTGLNLYSLFVAVIGAVIVLVVYHALVGGTRRTTV